jgi:formylglycine-generating enzyme required for sulfatase activity
MGGNEDPKSETQGIEKPKHTVRITKGFYFGKYEVTKDQYKAVTGKNQGHWPNTAEEPNRPVERLSWNDANEYCRLVREKTRAEVRLPTEAEWEYACRAGSDTEWSHCANAATLVEYAWFGAHGQGFTHSVGTKKPNAWGLYDIHGNAMEWVADWYGAEYYASSPLWDPTGPATGTLHIARGGGTSHSDHYQGRSATRSIYHPEVIRADTGCRVVLTLPP